MELGHRGKLVRTNLAMCELCPRRRRRERRPDACALDNRTTLTISMVGDCKLGRHVDEQGLIRWLGTRWRGLPWPQRVRIGLRKAIAGFRQAMDPDHWDFAGDRRATCGCNHAAKSRVERMRGK